MGLYPVEHPQSRIDTGLRGFPIATDDAKLRVAAAQEETSATLRTLIPVVLVIVPHDRATATISVAVPSVSPFTPTSTVEAITISR
jgi:hypothetical protein